MSANNPKMHMTAAETPQRSWFVNSPTDGRDPVVVSSFWSPGYTIAHKETKEEALAYAIEKRIEQIKAIRKELEVLNEMQAVEMFKLKERTDA